MFRVTSMQGLSVACFFLLTFFVLVRLYHFDIFQWPSQYSFYRGGDLAKIPVWFSLDWGVWDLLFGMFYCYLRKIFFIC